MNYRASTLLLALLALNANAQERITNVTTAVLGDRIIYPEFSVPATTLIQCSALVRIFCMRDGRLKLTFAPRMWAGSIQ